MNIRLAPLLQFPLFSATRRVALLTIAKNENITPKEIEMNWDQVEGNWKQFKGKVQQKWGKLTNDDLDVIEGKKDELAGRLQERYGWRKEQAEEAIDNWND